MIHLKEKGDNVRTLLDSVSSCVSVGGQELSILEEAAELVWDAWRELVSLETCLRHNHRPEAEPGVRGQNKPRKESVSSTQRLYLHHKHLQPLLCPALSCSCELATANWMGEGKSQRQVDQETGNPACWISHLCK